jgi:long-chain acyl-CoA synthetase
VSRLTGSDEAARVLVPGPLTSTLFLYAAVHAAATGATPLLAPLGTTQPWTHAHLVPTQLADLIASGTELAGRTVVVGGAALDPGLAAAARLRGLRVVAYYGSSELSFVAMGSLGALRPFPGVDVAARDGVLHARSRYLALDVAGPDGWATAGDRGWVDADGLVTVAGRGSSAISVGGATVLAEDVEAVLRAVPGVRDAVVVGSPHPRLGQVVAAVVAVDGSGPTVRTLRQACATALRPAQRPRRWRLVDQLPRGPGGKPLRRGW